MQISISFSLDFSCQTFLFRITFQFWTSTYTHTRIVDIYWWIKKTITLFHSISIFKRIEDLKIVEIEKLNRESVEDKMKPYNRQRGANGRNKRKLKYFVSGYNKCEKLNSKKALKRIMRWICSRWWFAFNS